MLGSVLRGELNGVNRSLDVKFGLTIVVATGWEGKFRGLARPRKGCPFIHVSMAVPPRTATHPVAIVRVRCQVLLLVALFFMP